MGYVRIFEKQLTPFLIHFVAPEIVKKRNKMDERYFRFEKYSNI